MNLNLSKKNYLNLFLVTSISIIFGYIAGWRDDLFDRQNYVFMFEQIAAADELEIKLMYAKDLSFLLFSLIGSCINPDPKFTFFCICFVSFFTKFFAVEKIPKFNLTLFILFYVILLSPGLEFAAIRSGLAIGFAILAVVYRSKKIEFNIFMFCSFISHASLVVVLPFSINLINNYLRKNKEA